MTDGFVPIGFVPLKHALAQAGKALFGGDWPEMPPSEAKVSAFYYHQRTTLAEPKPAGQDAEKLRRRRKLQLESAIDISWRGRSNRLALSRFETEKPAPQLDPKDLAKISAWMRMDRCVQSQMRQFLYAESIRASILTDQGRLLDVPKELWASEIADRAFRTGRATISVFQRPHILSIEGRVLVNEADLAAILGQQLERGGQAARETLTPNTARVPPGEAASAELALSEIAGEAREKTKQQKRHDIKRRLEAWAPQWIKARQKRGETTGEVPFHRAAEAALVTSIPRALIREVRKTFPRGEPGRPRKQRQENTPKK